MKKCESSLRQIARRLKKGLSILAPMFLDRKKCKLQCKKCKRKNRGEFCEFFAKFTELENRFQELWDEHSGELENPEIIIDLLCKKMEGE